MKAGWLVPYVTQYIHDDTGILRIGTGTVSGREIFDVVQASKTAIVAPDRITHVILDFSGVTRFAVSAAEVRSIALLSTANGRLARSLFVAVIAPSDEVFGMLRMWGALLDNPGWTLNFSHSREDSDAWLAASLASRGDDTRDPQ